MSSSQSLSVATSKSTNIPPQNSSSSQLQTNTSSGIDSHPQRRSGGSGSFGAGSLSRGASAAARSSQSLRKQHKGQRRPRLADEDAAAESDLGITLLTKHGKGSLTVTLLVAYTIVYPAGIFMQTIDSLLTREEITVLKLSMQTCTWIGTLCYKSWPQLSPNQPTVRYVSPPRLHPEWPNVAISFACLA
ncbi:MAG: hypothetical protein Q9190_000590 [Brigantiaea leucoxantha]